MSANPHQINGWGYKDQQGRVGRVGPDDSSFPPIPYGELPLGRVVGCSTVPTATGSGKPPVPGSRCASPGRSPFPPLTATRPGKNAHRKKTEFLRDTGANKTGFLGVKWSERKQYFEAYIRDHRAGAGRKVYCGGGKTPEDAARAYDRKARELYGARAVVNFPNEGQP